MEKPTFPLISIYNEEVLELMQSEEGYSNATAFGLIKQKDNNVAFDNKGVKWNYLYKAAKFKNDFITRLLTNTIYNPKLKVTLEWRKIGNYNIAELKEAINRCVDKDDDIVTQFAEGETIKEAVNSSDSFIEITKVLKKYVFEVIEEELWLEMDKE